MQRPKNYMKNPKRKNHGPKRGETPLNQREYKDSQHSITNFNSLGFDPLQRRKRSAFIVVG